ncbi:Inner membrane protein YedI [Rhodobacteraceae bacterium THAF1]|uniref:DUF808 domain-containing protein n=1 Tax=Palleronia sp. THAF1 TaxID=2587842 RepID=UPI000F3AF2BC|nr:DUF808 domain-containing protein [Palleronia sp. THAF1]QFU10174.1 Inner membrane protein YedI [Palleronia sp. THAF1]VDC16921.1 Inner membrane protein YedI [Rhodobacteraceae bacterium THAF1]
MSGIIALLDDVAAIAKVASASVDDVVGQAVKASGKAAGAVIDDAAVTPKYLQGFSAKRELPIVWKIARGSLFNKLVILLPVALLLATFAPFVIPILLMIGGAYLCFEGAEKVWHKINPSDHHSEELVSEKLSAAQLEEKKVKGAVKTDFILSAEIMTIVLNALPQDVSIWMTGASLAVAGIIITIVVYGAVALIVKADDVGLHMAAEGNSGFVQSLGRGIVRGMPTVMLLLVVIGTAAMIWVGGNIIVHALNELGWHLPYDVIHDLAVGAAASVPESLAGAVEWGVTAFLDGIIGLVLGLALIPVVTKLIVPLSSWLFPEKQATPH